MSRHPESQDPPPGDGDGEGLGSPRQVHILLLMALTVAGLYLCYRLAAPFVPAMAGALALAVVFSPLQRRLERRLRSGNIAAGACVLAVLVLVAVPAFLIASRLLDEIGRGARATQALIDSGSWRAVFDQHALLAPVGQWLDKQFDLGALVAPAAAWLTSAGASLLQGSVFQAVAAILVFYMLFYMLRDRAVAMHALRSLSPLSVGDM